MPKLSGRIPSVTFAPGGGIVAECCLEGLCRGLQAHGAKGAGEALDGVGTAGGAGAVAVGEGVGDGPGGVPLGGGEVAQEGGVELDIAFHAAQPGGRVEARDGIRKALHLRHDLFRNPSARLQRPADGRRADISSGARWRLGA